MRVLLPAPYWVSYSAIATLCEAKYVEIPSSIDSDFKITPAQLEAAITPKTKMIFFNSPNNPSGSIYSEEEYRALAKVLEKHPQIYILSDEIYEHINYGTKPFSFASYREHVRSYHYCKRIGKSICDDWLENWFYWCTTMDS